ncbi:MAG: transcriptional regulator [Proteobacteria bacterium]|nr:transcriptional regulator [Pseudomonadota bacterium]
MDIRNMVEFLVKKGLTEDAIAKQINAHQSTVSRILSGRIKDPRASIALGIVALFENVQQKVRPGLEVVH